jgi:adenine phosphoribosyltransferase
VTEDQPLQLETLIRAIPDFPLPGILFRDITPMLKDARGFKAAIDRFVDAYRDARLDLVVAIEARGYIFGAPLAYALGTGFVPVRKPGKLPGTRLSEEYALEYGTNTLEIHDDAVGHGQRVLVVDDVLATGGTAAATGRLLHRLGADVVGYAFLVELAFLNGRELLGTKPVTAFVTY